MHFGEVEVLISSEKPGIGRWVDVVILGFEDYRLDTARRELWRGSALVAIEPQVFDLLHYLISCHNRFVSKDDLVANVWGGRIVSDSAITSRITAVRHAVGDSGEAQRLIRTIPRKGFRFVGEVREELEAPQSTGKAVQPTIATGEVPPSVEIPDVSMGGAEASSQSDAKQRRQFMPLARVAPLKAALLAGTVLAAVAVWAVPTHEKTGVVAPLLHSDSHANDPWRSPIHRGPGTSTAEAMAARALVPIAVLPFGSRNGHGGEDQEIADAITEDVTNALSRFQQLRVIAHRTARVYGARPTDVAILGAELGIRYVVEGSVRFDGNRLRVTVHLIDAASRHYAWTEHFDRDREDTVSWQDDIAKGLARALQVGVNIAQGRDPPRVRPAIGALIARGFATQ